MGGNIHPIASQLSATSYFNYNNAAAAQMGPYPESTTPTPMSRCDQQERTTARMRV